MAQLTAEILAHLDEASNATLAVSRCPKGCTVIEIRRGNEEPGEIHLSGDAVIDLIHQLAKALQDKDTALWRPN